MPDGLNPAPTRTHLIAPAGKVRSWLEAMRAAGERLLDRARSEQGDAKTLSQDVHRWYLVLFDGFQRAFSRDSDELNLNLVVAYVAHVADPWEHLRVEIGEFLRLVEQARGLCGADESGRSSSPQR